MLCFLVVFSSKRDVISKCCVHAVQSVKENYDVHLLGLNGLVQIGQKARFSRKRKGNRTYGCSPIEKILFGNLKDLKN